MDNNLTDKDLVSIPFFEHQEVVTRQERHIVRLLIALVMVVILLFVSNLIWLHKWSQFDFASDDIEVTSEYEGNANYIGGDGDITNGNDKSTQSSDDETQR